MKENRHILLAISCVLVIQLFVSFLNEFRLSKIEKKIDEYFAPIENVELPQWGMDH
jgi:hypothetical protein